MTTTKRTPTSYGGAPKPLATAQERLYSANDYGLPDEHDVYALLARAQKSNSVASGNAEPAYTPRVVPLNGTNTGFNDVVNRSTLPKEPVVAPASRVGQIPIERIRADFPILSEQVDGKPLIWLDNA